MSMTIVSIWLASLFLLYQPAVIPSKRDIAEVLTIGDQEENTEALARTVKPHLGDKIVDTNALNSTGGEEEAVLDDTVKTLGGDVVVVESSGPKTSGMEVVQQKGTFKKTSLKPKEMKEFQSARQEHSDLMKEKTNLRILDSESLVELMQNEVEIVDTSPSKGKELNTAGLSSNVTGLLSPNSSEYQRLQERSAHLGEHDFSLKQELHAYWVEKSKEFVGKRHPLYIKAWIFQLILALVIIMTSVGFYLHFKNHPKLHDILPDLTHAQSIVGPAIGTGQLLSTKDGVSNGREVATTSETLKLMFGRQCLCSWCLLCCCCWNPLKESSNRWALANFDMYSSRVRQPFLTAAAGLSVAEFAFEIAPGLMAIPVQNAKFLGPFIQFLIFAVVMSWMVSGCGFLTLGNNIYHNPKVLVIPIVLQVLGPVATIVFQAGRKNLPSELTQMAIGCVSAIWYISLALQAMYLNETLYDEVEYRSELYVRQRFADSLLAPPKSDLPPRRSSGSDKAAGRRSSGPAAHENKDGEKREAGAINKKSKISTAHPPIFYPPLLIMSMLLAATVILEYCVSTVEKLVVTKAVFLSVLEDYEVSTSSAFGVDCKHFCGSRRDPIKIQEKFAVVQKLQREPFALLEVGMAELPCPVPQSMIDSLANSIVKSATENAKPDEAMKTILLTVEEVLYYMVVALPYIGIIAATLSLALAAFSLASSVIGFRREYVKAVRGKSPYRDITVLNNTISIASATNLPGLILSLSFLCVWFTFTVASIVSLFLYLFVLLPIFVPSTRSVLAEILLICAPFVLVLIFRTVVLDMLMFRKWLSEKDAIKHPGGFSLAFSVVSIVNVAIGVLLAIFRLVMVLAIYSLTVMFRVDISGLGQQELLLFDPAYDSFTTYAYLMNQEYNPLFRFATRVFSDFVSRKNVDGDGASSANQDGNDQLSQTLTDEANKEFEETETAARAARALHLRVRNRFWLMLILARNPSLAKFRSHTYVPPEAISLMDRTKFDDELREAFSEAQEATDSGLTTVDQSSQNLQQ